MQSPVASDRLSFFKPMGKTVRPVGEPLAPRATSSGSYVYGDPKVDVNEEIHL